MFQKSQLIEVISNHHLNLTRLKYNSKWNNPKKPSTSKFIDHIMQTVKAIKKKGESIRSVSMPAENQTKNKDLIKEPRKKTPFCVDPWKKKKWKQENYIY